MSRSPTKHEAPAKRRRKGPKPPAREKVDLKSYKQHRANDRAALRREWR